MYERGSNQWHDSYGSGASYSNGNGNGSMNGSGAEHVWYRSPSGEEPQYPTAQQPMPQQPTYQPSYQPTYQPSYQPSYEAPAYEAPSYEATTYEAAYAPAAQSSPATPTYAAGPPAPDVTVYDPATGLPMAGEPVVYPMRNVAGRMAMILGVVAILCTSVLFPLFPLAFFFGVGAILLGRRGRLRARYGFASNPGSAGGGFALGIIAIVLAVIWSAAAAWLFTTYSATDLRNCIEDNTTAGAAISCIGTVVDAA